MTDAELTAIEAKQPLVDRWGMPWDSAIPWSVATEMDADIGRLTAEVRRLRGMVDGAYQRGFEAGAEQLSRALKSLGVMGEHTPQGDG